MPTEQETCREPDRLRKTEEVGNLTVCLAADTKKTEEALDRVALKLREIIGLAREASTCISRLGQPGSGIYGGGSGTAR